MEISYQKKCSYILVEDSKKETMFSTVYKAFDIALNNRLVAVKCVNINKDKKRQECSIAKQEILAMVKIREKCENIPMIYDFFYDENACKMYIIMEWVEGETLADIFRRGDLSEGRFISYIVKLVYVLCLMEEMGIYHKDIKPSNIIIRDFGKENEKLYLIDFNISLSQINPIEGTPLYRAPEVGTKLKYVKRDKVDMFAVGVMLYEYYLGRTPQPLKEYYDSIDDNFSWSMFVSPKANENLKRNISDQMNQIIEVCMKYNPTERYDSNRSLLRELRKIGGKNGRNQ